jgi:hypothetical protein
VPASLARTVYPPAPHYLERAGSRTRVRSQEKVEPTDAHGPKHLA